MINFRGLTPIYLPAVWKLKIPPRIQVFLWLFSQNKIMTRNNLRARGIPKPMNYEMCTEFESVQHLMFDCVVAKSIWNLFEEVFDMHVTNFESIASKWLCNKKFMHYNVASSAVLWGLWLNRNSLVFNKTTWINVKQVWRRVFFLLRDWKKPFKELDSGRNTQFMDLLLASLKASLCLPVG
jgi:hypothetical protein